MPALAPQRREAIRTMLAEGVRPKAISRKLGVGTTVIRKYGRGVERPRFVPSSKVCTVCGNTYYPTAPTLTPSGWAKRVACSVQCGTFIRHGKS